MLLALLTALTLIAFAANSLLARTALGDALIDPVSFTTIRLASGAAVLFLMARAGSDRPSESHGSWISGLALFAYAAAFSLAYLSLDAGTGALILFGAVQATMLGVGLWRGERPHPLQWAGLTAAVAGLVYLVSPGITAPDLLGALLMLLSGVAWGVYSLRGQGVTRPVLATASNFARSVPFAALASVAGYALVRAETWGAILAVVSGAVTSGLGYVLWYRVLRNLTTTQAAILQLLVPVIAATGGVAFLSESVSLRLGIASVLILGGVAIAVLRGSGSPPAREKAHRT